MLNALTWRQSDSMLMTLLFNLEEKLFRNLVKSIPPLKDPEEES